MGKTTIEILQRIKIMLEDKGLKPALKTGSLFMSMYNDVEYWKKNNQNECFLHTVQHKSPSMHETSNQDIGHSFDLEKKKVCGSITNKICRT